MTRFKTLPVICEQFSIQILLIQIKIKLRSLTVFGHILFLFYCRDCDRCKNKPWDTRCKTDSDFKDVLNGKMEHNHGRQKA